MCGYIRTALSFLPSPELLQFQAAARLRSEDMVFHRAHFPERSMSSECITEYWMQEKLLQRGTLSCRFCRLESFRQTRLQINFHLDRIIRTRLILRQNFHSA